MLPELSEIRRMRKAAGITQRGLSLGSRVPQSTIAKIEGGRTKEPSYSSVKRLLDFLEGKAHLEGVLVGELSNPSIIRVQSSERVRKALSLMRENDISQLPVFSAERPVGSITEKTVLEFLRQGQTLEQLAARAVAEVMGPPLPIVPETANVSQASPILEKFSAALVSSSRTGRIRGIVTRADLLKGGK